MTSLSKAGDHNKNNFSYRADIDGLRAIAVLLIVGYHAFPELFKGGFVGVDIFFVISGFLISGIILRDLDNQKFSYLEFYARRIRRIFPALLVVLIASLVFGWFFLFSDEYLSLGKHTAAGAGFVANIVYWTEAGYFDKAAEFKPLLHLWSLGVEEQFYLFWPVLLALLFKINRKFLAPSLAVMIAGSFLLNFTRIGIDSNAAFYLPFTRFWELLLGAIISYAVLFGKNVYDAAIRPFKKIVSVASLRIVHELLSFTGLLFILGSIFILNKNIVVYPYGLLLPTLGAFLVIAVGNRAFINRKILSNRVLVFFGLISYPLYLWHWPILSFLRIITAGELSLSIILIAVVSSIILAWLTYIFIERPIRLAGGRSAVLALCLAMFIVASAGLTVFLKGGFAFRFPQQEKLIASMSRGGDISDDACANKYQKDIGNNYCQIAGSGSDKIFIIGDSHSQAIFTSYGAALAKTGYQVINLGNSSCPFLIPEIDIKKLDVKERGQIRGCNEKITKIFTVLSKEQPKYIILANDGWDYRREIFESGMRETLKNIPKNINVVWFLQNPKVPFDLKSCVARPVFQEENYKNCSFERSVFDKWTQGYADAVLNLKSDYPEMVTVDPSSVVCDSKKCDVVLNNEFLYNDATHFSLFGSNYLMQRIPFDKFLTKYSRP